jgi:5-formyltetrahydrofolate cyclo-ligase
LAEIDRPLVNNTVNKANQAITKTDLRKNLLGQRRALSVDEWRIKSDRISQILRSDRAFRSAQTVLAYFSTRQEPDLSSLWTETEQTIPNQTMQSQTFGFPLCEGNHLLWRQWGLGDPLVAGKFGIQEPDRGADSILPEQVDLMLVPCVGCDRAGYRCGYGGGFYDRLLAKPEWRSVQTIGIVFDFSVVEMLPVDSWDQPLDRICHDQGFLSFKTN